MRCQLPCIPAESGNLLFLMMSDRNDGGTPIGRGRRGGYPAGAVSMETFQWWKQMVEQNQGKIIVTCHHHVLKDTTVASWLTGSVVSVHHRHWR